MKKRSRAIKKATSSCPCFYGIWPAELHGTCFLVRLLLSPIIITLHPEPHKTSQILPIRSSVIRTDRMLRRMLRRSGLAADFGSPHTEADLVR